MPNDPGAPTESSDDEIINFRAVFRWCAFGVRSVQRHKAAVLGTVAVVMALTAIGLVVLPKSYHVQSKLLAQRSGVLAVSGEQQKADPTRAAADTILRRDNLVDLIKSTHLLEEWPKRRAPILRFKDWAMKLVSRPATEAERIDGLVGYLLTKMYVQVGEGTITIQLDWPDAQMAYRLVDAAQRNFIEARHVQEVSTVAESASILEGHASDSRREIDAAVKDLQVLREKRKGEKVKETEAAVQAQNAAPHPAPAPVFVARAPTPAASAEAPALDANAERRLAELPVVVEAKQRTIKDLEDYRQRRLAELHGQLDEKRAIYTEAHPVITDLQQAIIGVSQESPQVTRLRGELKGLQAEYENLRANSTVAHPRLTGGIFMPGPGMPSHLGLPNEIHIDQEPAEERDPEIEYARSRLRFAIKNYQQLEERIQSSRVDLDTAEAAFKYLYTVIMPPEVPRGPMKPKAPQVMIGAVFAGILLGLMFAIGSDLRRGVLYEGWQVERLLSLPVLSEVPLLPDQHKRK